MTGEPSMEKTSAMTNARGRIKAAKVTKAKKKLGVDLVRKPKPKKPRMKGEFPAAERKKIPQTLEDCDAADKTLYEMKQAGKTWDEIRAAVEKITGEKVLGQSSLPNRYDRMNKVFCHLADKDQVIMLHAKKAVEDDFHDTKWKKIRAKYKQMGGEEHSAKLLQRFYKKMMTADGYVPPAGVRDADFA